VSADVCNVNDKAAGLHVCSAVEADAAGVAGVDAPAVPDTAGAFVVVGDAVGVFPAPAGDVPVDVPLGRVPPPTWWTRCVPPGLMANETISSTTSAARTANSPRRRYQ